MKVIYDYDIVNSIGCFELEKEAKLLDDNLLTKILQKVYQDDLNISTDMHETPNGTSELYI